MKRRVIGQIKSAKPASRDKLDIGGVDLLPSAMAAFLCMLTLLFLTAREPSLASLMLRSYRILPCLFRAIAKEVSEFTVVAFERH